MTCIPEEERIAEELAVYEWKANCHIDDVASLLAKINMPLIQGLPVAPDGHSVEELLAFGLVGLYKVNPGQPR